MKRFPCGLVASGTLGILLCWGAVAEADFTIMPLGASTTYGGAAGFDIVPGGYRTRLYSDLHNAGYTFTFVGTVTENASPLLTQAGQTHHEGHPGYTVDQIANNLDGNDGSGGNDGGLWFHKPAPPNIVLLLIGGSDIYRQAMPLAERLEITHVHARPEGDRHFPPIDDKRWRAAARSDHPAGPQDEASFSYVTYLRA